MKAQLVLRSMLPLILLLWFAAACAPAEVVPVTEQPLGQADTLAIPTEQALRPVDTATPDSYPRYGVIWPTATHAPGPYPPPTNTPRPTITPGPSPTPRPTRLPAPTETVPPVPTLPPTPVVTIAPTAAPPVIPFPEGTTAEPFTVYYRDTEERISAISSAPGAEARVFLDPATEFGLYLVAAQALFGEWGAISPDGRTFALMLSPEPAPPPEDYLSSNKPVHIYLYDVDSGALSLFAENAIHPVWSPDGARLAYGHDGSLWVAQVETRESRPVFTPADIPIFGPTWAAEYRWAHDNSQLLVVREQAFVFYELDVVPVGWPDEARAIVPSADATNTEWVRAAQWSPVADEIVVARYTDQPPYYPYEVCVLNQDGVEQRCHTYDFTITSPAWSPDGRHIAFSAYPIYEPEPADWDLWLVDPSTGEPKRLTYGEATGSSNLDPMWSPDGTQILFNRPSPDGVHEAWVMSLLDGSERKLVSPAYSKKAGLVIGP